MELYPIEILPGEAKLEKIDSTLAYRFRLRPVVRNADSFEKNIVQGIFNIGQREEILPSMAGQDVRQ